ncbi:MAG: cobalt-precorrin 5A hydrolase [Tepidibacillus sp.]
MVKKAYAIVAITKKGVSQARFLHEQLPDSDLYYPKKWVFGDEEEKGIYVVDGSMATLLSSLFLSYRGLILFMALGAVVRIIAPLIKDKRTDPAVVVLDDIGQYVISVLSGHLGGANHLANQVSNLIGAVPVITTSSDVNQKLAVDLLGVQYGWQLDSVQHVTAVSAAVVNDEKIAIIQEVGERDWWPSSIPRSEQFTFYSSISSESRIKEDYQGAIVITDRLLHQDEWSHLPEKTILYRPKTLVVGIGCNRGTSASEIESVIFSTLEEERLSWKSIDHLATIDLKRDELGLLEIRQKYQWPIVFYTKDKLNQVSIQHPSETVYHHIGVYGVSEPAASLSARTNQLLLQKIKAGNVTISIGRLEKGGNR